MFGEAPEDIGNHFLWPFITKNNKTSGELIVNVESKKESLGLAYQCGMFSVTPREIQII